MTADAANADGLTLPTTNVASSEQQGLTIWYVRISNKRNENKIEFATLFLCNN
jgi:hypothetical protein